MPTAACFCQVDECCKCLTSDQIFSTRGRPCGGASQRAQPLTCRALQHLLPAAVDSGNTLSFRHITQQYLSGAGHKHNVDGHAAATAHDLIARFLEFAWYRQPEDGLTELQTVILGNCHPRPRPVGWCMSSSQPISWLHPDPSRSCCGLTSGMRQQNSMSSKCPDSKLKLQDISTRQGVVH